MKRYGLFVMAFGMAVLLSGTCAAQSDAKLFTVAQRQVENTDFTTAAESPIHKFIYEAQRTAHTSWAAHLCVDKSVWRCSRVTQRKQPIFYV